jgi:phospholipid/cholesterol/gamma-HCH transport system substrate-binding protein
MAHHTRWTDLSIGMFSALAIVAAALGILLFGRVGRLHGKTFTLYVTTDAARGVIRGTEVWLDGQKVGLVRDVQFRSPAVPPSERVVMRLAVLDDVRDYLRHDSDVQVRAGGTIIGDQVVYISSGHVTSPAIAANDTIHSVPQNDFESISSDAALASREFPAIVANVKLLGAQLHSAQGTLGAFGLDNGQAQLRRLRANTDRVLAQLSTGGGTVALARNNADELTARARQVLAGADSIRTLLGSNEHSLGRFRRDSTIMRDITDMRAQMDTIQRLAESPDGTIGRMRADTVITRNLHLGMAALDSLFADIKKHPLRYLVF